MSDVSVLLNIILIFIFIGLMIRIFRRRRLYLPLFRAEAKRRAGDLIGAEQDYSLILQINPKLQVAYLN